MPRKVQNKGKPKSSTEESDDFVFRKKSTETLEEDYTTVVDFESNKKYNKRLITNNWSKYEAAIGDFESSHETTQLPKTDDFTTLLKTASSDYSHFQFSWEKEWNNENAVPASEIFNLDLRTLSKGLACVPFHERIGLEESQISLQDKERFHKAAEESLKEYNSVREKNKTMGENEGKNLDFVKEEVCGGDVKDKSEDSEEGQRVEKNEEVSGSGKKFFTENDENLEDWLDSVLDD